MKPLELIARVPNLPTPAPSVMRLISALARPDGDNDDVARIIAQDGVLSAKLLARCNNASYGLSEPISSIDQAVLYLGQSEIKKLAMSLGFAGSLTPELKGYAIGDSELWRHSLLTAYVAVAIAAKKPRIVPDPSIAYTAGLIHDIGKTLISHALNSVAQSAVLELVERKESSLIDAEREVLGTDHAEVGAALLRKWNLPEILVEAVENQHKPVSKPKPQLSAVVHVADVVALEAGCAPGLGSFAMHPDDAAIEALGLDANSLDQLVVASFDWLAEVKDMVAVK